MRRLLVLAALFALSLSGTPAGPAAEPASRSDPKPREPQRWALLIGVNDYAEIGKLEVGDQR